MISIIVCSKFRELQQSLIDNISSTIGVEYELICIDNSENKYSIFEAYNLGFRRSKYPFICYVHEDVKFHTMGWGIKMIAHMQRPTAGICGLAGGGLVSHVPASWKGNFSYINIIQSDRTGKKASQKVRYPSNVKTTYKNVVLLDGVLLCMNRHVAEKLRFDESINGFHGYDLDICIQSHTLGYNNCVMFDVAVEHFSRGNRDALYFRNLVQIYHKWNSKLPLFAAELSVSSPKMKQIDTKKLFKLTYKLVKRGFAKAEIVDEILKFATKAKLSKLLRSKLVVMFIVNVITLADFKGKTK